MPDTTPPPEAADQPEGPPTSSRGARRSGLDRLRAAQSGGAESASVSGVSAAPTTTGERGSRGGDATTALLDSPEQSRPATPDADSPFAPGSPVEVEVPGQEPGSGKGRRGRRARKAKAAAGATGTAAAETAGTDTTGTDTTGTGTAGTDTTGEGAVGTTAAPTASGRQRLLAALLGVLVVALLVGVVLKRHNIYPSKQDRSITSLSGKQQAAVDAARRFTITFFSPDYRTVDNYNNQVMSLSTGDFNKDFAGKRGDLKSVLTQVQSQATGKVLAAGASRVSSDSVDVLLVVDQDVKNKSSNGKTLTNRYRVQVTMQQSPKGWLVSQLIPVV